MERITKMKANDLLCLTLAAGLALSTCGGLPGADVVWTANTGGDWEEPENWSTAPFLPGVADNVTISVADPLQRTPITHSAGTDTVNSLTLHEELKVEGGSLAVTNQLTLAPGSQLTVTGLETGFAAGGGVIADGANLHAGSIFEPGVLSLPQLEHYTHAGQTTTNVRLQAFQAGSELDLSSLHTITGADAFVQLVILSINGGRIDLSSLSTVARRNELGTVKLEASGPGSEIDVSSLADFTNTAIDEITVEAGGTLKWGNPTALDAITLTIGGPLETAAIASFTNGTLRVRNGTQPAPNLTGITNANGSTFEAGAMDSGTLSLPNLTEYSLTKGPFTNSSFKALGAGSTLDLSSLKVIHAGVDPFDNLKVEAGNGGHVDLSQLSAVVPGNDDATISVMSESTGSEVNLSSLDEINNGAIRKITALGGGTVRMSPTQTRMGNVEIELRAGLISSGEIVLESGASILGGGTVAADVHNFAGKLVSGVVSTAPLVIEGRLLQSSGAETEIPVGTVLQVVGLAVLEEGAILSGAGTLQAGVQMGGELRVDASGTLRVNGDLALSDTAVLRVADDYSLDPGSGSGLFTALEVTGNLSGQFSTPAGAGVESHLGRGHFLTALVRNTQDLQVSVLATYPGDTDGDLDVDFPDFVRLSNGFGGPGNWTNGDFDNDGQVEFPDFVALANRFGQSFTPSTASVPEPQIGVVLLVVALLFTARQVRYEAVKKSFGVR